MASGPACVRGIAAQQSTLREQALVRAGARWKGGTPLQTPDATFGTWSIVMTDHATFYIHHDIQRRRRAAALFCASFFVIALLLATAPAAIAQQNPRSARADA